MDNTNNVDTIEYEQNLRCDDITSLYNILNSINHNIVIDLSSFEATYGKTYTNIIKHIIVKTAYKIDIIKSLYNYNLFKFSNKEFNDFINVLHHLLEDDESKNINQITHYRKICKTLGNAIYDAYRKLDYDIIISNFPTESITVDNVNEKIKVTPENMYDTIELHSGENSVDNVRQITYDTYLVKFKVSEDKIKICNMINNANICGNVIKVQLLIDDRKNKSNCKSEVTEVTELTEVTEVTEDKSNNQSHNESIDLISDYVISSGNDIDTGNYTTIDNRIDNTIDNLLVVDLAYRFYNKLCGITNFILRR